MLEDYQHGKVVSMVPGGMFTSEAQQPQRAPSSADNVGERLYSLMHARSAQEKLWSVRDVDVELMDFSRECAMAGAVGTGLQGLEE